MLRRVAALYNNSKVLLCHPFVFALPSDLQSVLYFLYGALLVSFLGEELTVILTYFYLGYIDGGMMSIFPVVVRGSNYIRSHRTTSGRRAVLCMHTNRISASFLGVRISHCNAPWVSPLTFLFDPSFW